MKPCDVCIQLEERGTLPDKLNFHCPICHISFRSERYVHCHDIDVDGNVIGCGRSFGGQVAYDAHKGPSGICRDPDTLTRENGEPRFHATRRNTVTVWVQSRLGGSYVPKDRETRRNPRSTPRRKDVA